MADRLQQLSEQIFPTLRAGGIVLCDRYVYTGLVEAVVRSAPRIDLLAMLASLFPKPDVSVLLDIDVAVARTRVANRPTDRTHWCDDGLATQLAEGYRILADQLGFVVVNTTGGMAPSHELARQLVQRLTRDGGGAS